MLVPLGRRERVPVGLLVGVRPAKGLEARLLERLESDVDHAPARLQPLQAFHAWRLRPIEVHHEVGRHQGERVILEDLFVFVHVDETANEQKEAPHLFDQVEL